MNKSISEKRYLFLVTFLPIIALLLGLGYRAIRLKSWETFHFSLSIDYYIPILVLGLITFFYAILILYSKQYNRRKFFKIVTFFYLLLFVLLQVFSFYPLFLSRLLDYEGLNVFIMFNLVIYLVLVGSNKR